MNFFKFFLLFLVCSFSLLAQNTERFNPLFEFEDKTFKELSLKEWKKFKDFEQKLILIPELEQKHKLQAFARDSIQILGVKLMATRLLDEKQLLDRDIAENGAYYQVLLQELRESAIPKGEYLFLEEKMALFNQSAMKIQLSRSRWLNFVLVGLCLVFGVWFFQLRMKRKALPELSKQEVIVRNLILEGKSNKEIANELFISLSTVKSHITNLYSKLNVASRQELFHKSTGAST